MIKVFVSLLHCTFHYSNNMEKLDSLNTFSLVVNILDRKLYNIYIHVIES